MHSMHRRQPMAFCRLPRFQFCRVVTYELREKSARRVRFEHGFCPCERVNFKQLNMQILRQFDVHPKVREEADILVRTFTGAVVTIISTIIMGILFLSEVNYYLTPTLSEELFVDTSRGSKLRINLDVIVPTISCDLLSIDAMDTTGEQHLQIEHNVFKRRLDLTGKPIEDPKRTDITDTKAVSKSTEKTVESTTEKTCGDCYGAVSDKFKCCNTCEDVREAYKDRNWAMPELANIKQCQNDKSVEKMKTAFTQGCQIYGYMEVNRVGGSFHIAPGDSFSVEHVHVHDVQPYTSTQFNMTHQIRHLSFGLNIPGKTNPMDNITVIALEGAMMFYHYIKIVPTTYVRADGSTLLTNQFSVTRHARQLSLFSGESGMPGIFFSYELSPLMVTTWLVRALSHRVYSGSTKSVVGTATESVRRADWTLSGQRLDRDGGQEEASFSSREIYRVTDISWSSCSEDRFVVQRATSRSRRSFILAGSMSFQLYLQPPGSEARALALKELRETEENVKKATLELKKFLEEDKTLYFSTDDEFLLIFLRPCKFYAQSAYELMKRVAEFKDKNASLFDNLMPSDETQAFLQNNVVNVLKGRDHKGRRVLVVNSGKTWDPSRVSSDQILRLFYLIHDVAMLEPETQIFGTVVIMDFDGLSMKQVMGLTPSFSMKLLNFIQDAMPLRLKEVHIVKQPFLFNMVWQMFKPFVREKLKKRMFFHGNKMSSLHTHIPPSHLPKNYDGDLPEINYSSADWYPVLIEHEEKIREWNTYGYRKN